MAWSEIIESILSHGIAMHDLGVNNWALNKEQALLAIDEFEKKNISVLGGDVYELSNGVPESNYDSWHCDRSPGESSDDFMHRSISDARQYINNYTPLTGKDIFFVLVVE